MGRQMSKLSQFGQSVARRRRLNQLRDNDYLETISGCIFKMSFPSKRIAAARGRKLGMRPYKCKQCKKWHLSSQRRP